MGQHTTYRLAFRTKGGDVDTRIAKGWNLPLSEARRTSFDWYG